MRGLRAPMVVVCAALGNAGSARAQTPGFHLIGLAPGGSFSKATAVSADGRWVTGQSSMEAFPGTLTPYLWSFESGRLDLLNGAGAPSSAGASAIADGGSFIVGTGGFGGTRAYRRSDTSGYQNLGVIGGHETSRATGVSGDGSVVVGYCETFMSFNGMAFRWTPSTGMQNLGYTRPWHISAKAYGVSRDGSTIVGSSTDPGGFTDAFAWTSSGGMRILPLLAGSLTGEAVASNVDGSLIVGTSSDGVEPRRAVLWSGGQVTNLGSLPGWLRSGATGLSDAGDLVTVEVMNGLNAAAAVWTPGTGLVAFPDYLASQGMSIPTGWRLGSSFTVSGDGHTFVGSVSLPNNVVQGLVITVPAPGSLAMLACLGARPIRRRRT